MGGIAGRAGAAAGGAPAAACCQDRSGRFGSGSGSGQLVERPPLLVGVVAVPQLHAGAVVDQVGVGVEALAVGGAPGGAVPGPALVVPVVAVPELDHAGVLVPGVEVGVEAPAVALVADLPAVAHPLQLPALVL